MATNFVQAGEVIDYTNATGSDIASGAVVIMGGTIGVALTNIADTESGSVAVEGVFTLPKVSAAVIAQGEGVIWDTSAGAFDDNAATPATGDVSGAAIAWAAAGNGETTVKVKLNRAAGTVA